MGKVRVYSLAQELNVKSNVLLDMLKEMGQEVSNHMSTLEDETVDILRNKVKAMGAGQPSAPAAEVKQEAKTEQKVEQKPAQKPVENNAGQREAKPAEANARPQQERRENRPQGENRPNGENRRENRPAHTEGGQGNQGRPQERRDNRPQGENRNFNNNNNNTNNNNNNRPAQGDNNRRENRPAQAEGGNNKPQFEKREGRPNEGRNESRPNNNGNRPASQDGVKREVRPEGNRDGGKPNFNGKRDGNGKPGDMKREGDRGRDDRRNSKPAPAAAGTTTSVDAKKEAQNAYEARKEKEARFNPENKKEKRIENVEKNEFVKEGGSGSRRKRNRPQSDNTSKFAHAEVAEEISVTSNDTNTIEVEMPLTVKTFAEILKVPANSIIAKLIGLGVMATINQNLDADTIELLAADFGKSVVFKSQEEKIKARVIEDRPEDMVHRPPIVTIMGHVDHGKTSLLDVIRHANVTATEAGGITQHIGAYQAMIHGKKITFLDTPGHEAFTAMRARGAQLTDIAILVVAADDGVMPQTIEAINHAKAAGIQIIVAINKIDKDNANPDRVLQELSEHGLIPESWGGDTICVPVSALKKMNIENLLEMILIVAEMGELKANPNRPAEGVVVEAELDKGRGPVATILVKRGTLKIGDSIIAGSTYGRVRAMISDKGERVDKATPSTPVVVLGLSDVPSAGDSFEVVDDDKTARGIAEERASRKRVEELQSNRAVTLDDLFKQIKEGEVKDLNIIIKADVQGSIGALQDSLLRLSTEEVRVTPIHTGVGAITESDVMLASASNAIIIGFNVRPDLNAQKLAEQNTVDIRTYRIIYQAIDEVKAALEGLLDPEKKEVVTGRATVRAVFKVPKLGAIAGLYVTDGKINRNAGVRLLRNGIVVHEGKIGSLKRFQDDVKEVAQGYECGLGIDGYNDVKEGDEMEIFIIEEVRRTLE